MSAFYSASVADFLRVSESELTGLLSIAYAQVGFSSQRPAQTLAWFADIAHLQNVLHQVISDEPRAANWTILLEFEIPLKQKRIDVVILTAETILVLELKSSHPGNQGLRQAEDYALLLHYFHRPSHHRKIVIFVVAPQPAQASETSQLFLAIEEAPAFWVERAEYVPWSQLAKRLMPFANEFAANPIDAADWLRGEYHAVPTIIDAAKALESGLHTVREIAHSRAARHDVEELTRFVDNLIHQAQSERSHVICFITGVPGSGKTLVGLNLALGRSDRHDPIHFMSGTGPLVKVLQAVLARSHRLRTGARAKDAERQAQTLIENVHFFASHYWEKRTDIPPSHHVIIFDEAQRAWNREQNLKKFKRDCSEPGMLLGIMERHEDWSVVIALVGGGQEINSGEAGLGEWGRALLADTRKPWKIFASPEALEGGTSVAGSRLFEETPIESVSVEPKLHLDVAVCNLRADFYARWVNHVITGDASAAAALEAHKAFPIFLTRSLDDARRILLENTRGESRCGLVGSSKATRLRAEGLEPDSSFHNEYRWDHWYLAGSEDTRSSYQLEVFATEFEIQGLELDWIRLCWGGDYIWSPHENRWIARSFQVATSKWRELTREDQIIFRQNSYRVLLTRARQGIVLFVPTGDAKDPTRSPQEFDATADFLLACGAQPATPAVAPKTPENTDVSSFLHTAISTA